MIFYTPLQISLARTSCLSKNVVLIQGSKVNLRPCQQLLLAQFARHSILWKGKADYLKTWSHVGPENVIIHPSKLRARRIGADPEKSDFAKLHGKLPFSLSSSEA